MREALARVRIRINTSLDSVCVTLNLSLVDVCQLAERNQSHPLRSSAAQHLQYHSVPVVAVPARVDEERPQWISHLIPASASLVATINQFTLPA